MKIKKTKLFALILVLAMVVFALTSCAACDNNDEAAAITSIDDLATARIGVQIATTGMLFVQDNLPDADLQEFRVGADAVEALLAGQLDAVIIDGLPALRFIQANEGRLDMLEDELTQEYYGIALPLESPYVDRFNEAIDTLRENGTLDAIYDYWINQNPEASRYESPEGTERPNGTLSMATNAGFEPFEFVENGEIVGFDVCLARAIGDLLGYEIEIIDMDFDAIIMSVQTGSADFGMAGMTVTDERREQVAFTQGYYNATQRVIVRIP